MSPRLEALLEKPSEQVWAIVSGLPSRVRRERPLVVLQAYIDESGFDGRSSAYVMAAVVALPEEWAAFSDEWQQFLDMRPRIKYFKCAEAMKFSGEFLHWSPALRDEKVKLLMGVIQDHKIGGFMAGVPVADFHNVADDRSLEWHPGTPYQFLFYNLMTELLSHLDQLDVRHSVEFIFDIYELEQHKILGNWQYMLENSFFTHKMQSRITGTPIFRKDTEFLPLQAADLTAWLCRRRFAERLEGLPPFDMPVRTPSNEMVNILVQWDEKLLRQNAEENKWRYGFGWKAPIIRTTTAWLVRS